MNKRTEQLIILKLQGGDPEAYSDIYKQYSVSLLRFIYFRVSDKELARDLMQEVFTRFIEVADKERITNIRAYLYRIARHLVIDFYKTSSRQVTVKLDKTGELKSMIGQEATEARLDLEIVIKAADNLKPVWREIVILKFIEGLEHEEIAAVIKRSVNYVRVNLHRAMKELKKQL